MSAFQSAWRRPASQSAPQSAAIRIQYSSEVMAPPSRSARCAAYAAQNASAGASAVASSAWRSASVGVREITSP